MVNPEALVLVVPVLVAMAPGAARSEESPPAPAGPDDTVASLDVRTLEGRRPAGRGDAAHGNAPDAVPAPPEGVKVGYQVETGIASTYVNRGILQYRSLGDPSSQSFATLVLRAVGPGDLTLSATNFTSLAHSDAQPGTALELDLSAAYGGRVGGLFNVLGGYSVALYPLATEHVDGAHELFGSIALAEGFVTPSIAVYGEFVRLRGAYATASLSKAIEVGPFTFTPALSAGVAGYAESPAHLNDITLSASAVWSVAAPLYLTLRGAYSYAAAPAALAPDTDGDGTSDRDAPVVFLGVGAQR